jgi:putative radical SAM enzyme (TIGR03279 family)
MSLPVIAEIDTGSPAESAGLVPGDEIVAIDGEIPSDVIRWHFLVDEADPTFSIHRGGLELEVQVTKGAGESLGAQVDASIFDRVRTCDNHCEFCFIYQLPKGMRRSLYLKDDDYRLSFLYGNFTTLTRFTEADLERVVSERLSPLYVSIHATDPEVRSRILRNPRGGYSLRWLRALLDFGIEVHGQVVVCPGVNDGDVLDDTLLGVLDQFPELSSLAVVPLGVSSYNTESSMRPHTKDEARRVLDVVEAWQQRFLESVGHRLAYAADEYYLLAGEEFPAAETYGDFAMHEDGIGMARGFESEFSGLATSTVAPQSGFFQWVDGAPAEGYREVRTAASANRGGEISPQFSGQTDQLLSVAIKPRRNAPIAILTGEYGAEVLRPLVDSLERNDIRIIEVTNYFFGGNIKVSGLMVGEDVQQVLETEPHGHRYLLPDVCLNNGRFLDGLQPSDFSKHVEIIPTNGAALRAALEPRGSSHQINEESDQ